MEEAEAPCDTVMLPAERVNVPPDEPLLDPPMLTVTDPEEDANEESPE